MKPPIYATETELCADFIAWMTPKGWTAYPETAGWDILFVDTEGHQLGVQAKLRLNFEVISQALPPLYASDVGPDHRALLVPQGKNAGADLCSIAGLEVYYGHGRNFHRHNPVQYALFDWNPERRHPLPGYVPDVAAGASAPVQLTKWKIGALRILATLEIVGFVTAHDFKRIGIDKSRWYSARWVKPHESIRGAWVRGKVPDFDKQHPKVYPQIRDEIAAGHPTMPPAQIELGSEGRAACRYA
jgi:hypothetical protein